MTTPSFVEANGLRFAYLEQGEGPLVLLVHGFPDTAHTWDEIRPALAEAGYRAVAPFTRGYLPTEVPQREAFDSDTLGRDIVALIEALGESSAIVVGHDWGASAAYSAAGLQPERVRMLVTTAIPHPAGLRPSLSLLWAVRHFFWLSRRGAADKLLKDDLAYIDELVARWSPTWDVPPDETAKVKEVFRNRESLHAALGYYRAASPRLPPGHRAKVKMPAVAFAGLDDIIAPEAYERERVRARYLDTYEIVKMPGGHFLHREHPEPFTRELLRVIEAHAV